MKRKKRITALLAACFLAAVPAENVSAATYPETYINENYIPADPVTDSHMIWQKLWDGGSLQEAAVTCESFQEVYSKGPNIEDFTSWTAPEETPFDPCGTWCADVYDYNGDGREELLVIYGAVNDSPMAVAYYDGYFENHYVVRAACYRLTDADAPELLFDQALPGLYFDGFIYGSTDLEIARDDDNGQTCLEYYAEYTAFSRQDASAERSVYRLLFTDTGFAEDYTLQADVALGVGTGVMVYRNGDPNTAVAVQGMIVTENVSDTETKQYVIAPYDGNSLGSDGTNEGYSLILQPILLTEGISIDGSFHFNGNAEKLCSLSRTMMDINTDEEAAKRQEEAANGNLAYCHAEFSLEEACRERLDSAAETEKANAADADAVLSKEKTLLENFMKTDYLPNAVAGLAEDWGASNTLIVNGTRSVQQAGSTADETFSIGNEMLCADIYDYDRDGHEELIWVQKICNPAAQSGYDKEKYVLYLAVFGLQKDCSNTVVLESEQVLSDMVFDGYGGGITMLTLVRNEDSQETGLQYYEELGYPGETGRRILAGLVWNGEQFEISSREEIEEGREGYEALGATAFSADETKELLSIRVAFDNAGTGDGACCSIEDKSDLREWIRNKKADESSSGGNSSKNVTPTTAETDLKTAYSSFLQALKQGDGTILQSSFQPGKDNFSFWNGVSYAYLGGFSKYDDPEWISDETWEHLQELSDGSFSWSGLLATCMSFHRCWTKAEASFQTRLHAETYQGDCYGMTALMTLFYNCDPETYQQRILSLGGKEGDTLFNLTYPYSNQKLTEGISFFQLTQYLFIAKDEGKEDGDWDWSWEYSNDERNEKTTESEKDQYTADQLKELFDLRKAVTDSYVSGSSSERPIALLNIYQKHAIAALEAFDWTDSSDPSDPKTYHVIRIYDPNTIPLDTPSGNPEENFQYMIISEDYTAFYMYLPRGGEYYSSGTHLTMLTAEDLEKLEYSWE